MHNKTGGVVASDSLEMNKFWQWHNEPPPCVVQATRMRCSCAEVDQVSAQAHHGAPDYSFEYNLSLWYVGLDVSFKVC